MKDFKFYLFCIVTLLCCISVNAEAEEFTEGYLVFQIDLDKSTTDATVSGYTDAMPENVVIPSTVSYNGQTFNVKTIREYAFEHCSSLTSIDFGNVETIGDGAFEYCSSLTLIDFGNVETIGYSAFYQCTSLTSLDLKNVKTIGDYAFRDCLFLTEIRTSETETPSVELETFESVVYSSAKLYVPIGSKEKYMNHAVWGLFTFIEEFNNNAITDVLSDKISVRGYKGNIFVEGVDNGGIINVYTVDGSLVASSKADGSNVQISVDANNVYIVKVGGRTFKLAL